MNDAQGNEGDPEEFERSVYRMECNPWDRAERGLVVEDIGEGAAQDRERLLVAVDGECGSLVDVERADIVEPENVVGMTMRQQYAIEAVDACAKRLVAKIGCGVNNHVLSISREQKRRPGTFVVGIFRPAHAAVAAERRHAHGSP